MSAKAYRDSIAPVMSAFRVLRKVWSIPGPRKNFLGLLVADGVLKDRTVVIGRKLTDIDEF